MTFNLEKTKKNMKMTSEVRAKQIDTQQEVGDMYGIDEALISFAYANISTKELKKIIKKENDELERLK
tara:strand:- start:354 stop:557 length:204 start_codon:yes stop_codon:yes gene_type:complete